MLFANLWTQHGKSAANESKESSTTTSAASTPTSIKPLSKTTRTEHRQVTFGDSVTESHSSKSYQSSENIVQEGDNFFFEKIEPLDNSFVDSKNSISKYFDNKDHTADRIEKSKSLKYSLSFPFSSKIRASRHKNLKSASEDMKENIASTSSTDDEDISKNFKENIDALANKEKRILHTYKILERNEDHMPISKNVYRKEEIFINNHQLEPTISINSIKTSVSENDSFSDNMDLRNDHFSISIDDDSFKGSPTVLTPTEHYEQFNFDKTGKTSNRHVNVSRNYSLKGFFSKFKHSKPGSHET